LETTATFDKEKNEFVLNTPNITAAKFWPGELGKFACYAAVFAKLIVNGRPMGIHPFLVQIRDIQTY
jgi:acyl-CoA oxidase